MIQHDFITDIALSVCFFLLKEVKTEKRNVRKQSLKWKGFLQPFANQLADEANTYTPKFFLFLAREEQKGLHKI